MSCLLCMQGLLDVTCKTVANMIKGKTPEEIRKTFNIKNDFTQAEEEQVRRIKQCQPTFSVFFLGEEGERVVRGEIETEDILLSRSFEK